MQQTLIIFKPSAVERALVGKVLARFEQKGLAIVGMKMMLLSEELLRQHYAHLVDKPLLSPHPQIHDRIAGHSDGS